MKRLTGEHLQSPVCTLLGHALPSTSPLSNLSQYMDAAARSNWPERASGPALKQGRFTVKLFPVSEEHEHG